MTLRAHTSVGAAVRAALGRRPWWMNAMLLFCAYMAAVAVPRDLLLTPLGREEEVWFGFVLRGPAAKATAFLHLAIYAAGAWGFWKMRRWMWPWAALYAAQIAISTGVWNLVDPRGRGWGGALLGVVFLIPALALWRSREAFGADGDGR